MTSRAFIAGCAGLALTPDETALLPGRAMPWGFILFRRNVDDARAGEGACALHLRESVGLDDAPILIDQEGGRVQRLGPPHWPKYPPGRAYGGAPGERSADAARDHPPRRPADRP